MSLFSAVRKIVAKVNEHTEFLKGVNEDFNGVLDRLDALEAAVDVSEKSLSEEAGEDKDKDLELED